MESVLLCSHPGIVVLEPVACLSSPTHIRNMSAESEDL